MPLAIANTKFNNEFRPTQDLNYLVGCIGEKIIVTIEFFYENIIFALVDSEIICAPTAASVGTFTNIQELIYCPDNFTAFVEYEVGDIINLQGSAAGNNAGIGGFTITEKISNQLIRIGGQVFVNESLPYGAGAYVSNITPYKGVRYSYNLLDSGSNYLSLIDGELQQLRTANGDAANPAILAMFFNGILSYQIGSGTIEGVSFINERQTFKLTHTTYITPFFLANQFSNLVNGIKPSYYLSGNCLNYIYKVQLSRNLTTPLALQSLGVLAPANTGWFGENFNGNPTNYNINGFTLQRVSDAIFLTKLEFVNEIEVVINIQNTTDPHPFYFGATQVCLNFCYLPENETLYQNNGRDQKDNFVFDRAFMLSDAAAINGDNYLTPNQIIKTAQVTFLNANLVQITARIEIGSGAQSIMTQGDFSRYMIWVTTEDAVRTNSDKVALLVDVNEIFVQTTEVDLIDNATVFIKHPYTDKADGEVATEVFPVDDLAARSDFSIDFTGRESDGIKINSINSRVFLSNGTDPDIILDDFVLNTSAYPLIAGLFQNMSFQQDRVFNIPAGEIRKVIDLQNNFAADAGLVHNWYMNFPFMVRWEYYLALAGLTSPPAGIFDSGEPLNGINNFWHRMTTVSGWQLKYRLRFNFEQLGDNTTQTFENIITSHDFNSNTQWINESIKSYDINAPFAELTFGGDKYVKGFENTTIKANFEWAAGPIPALIDIGMVLWIERFESSGVQEIRRISSFYVLDSGSWFLSSDGSGLVVITLVGSTFTGTCLVNSALLPAASQYRIYARLYHLPTASTGNKIFQDTDDFDFQDSAPYDFQ